MREDGRQTHRGVLPCQGCRPRSFTPQIASPHGRARAHAWAPRPSRAPQDEPRACAALPASGRRRRRRRRARGGRVDGDARRSTATSAAHDLFVRLPRTPTAGPRLQRLERRRDAPGGHAVVVAQQHLRGLGVRAHDDHLFKRACAQRQPARAAADVPVLQQHDACAPRGGAGGKESCWRMPRGAGRRACGACQDGDTSGRAGARMHLSRHHATRRMRPASGPR